MSRIEELAKINRSMTEQHKQLSPKQNPITVANIDSQLGGHIGRPELGMINNYLADRHSKKAQLATFKDIVSEKHKLIGDLSIKALRAEAVLIQEKLRTDFNHQYGALAERANAGEITVLRKLESVLEAARELLFGDRSDAFRRLDQRLTAGEISKEDFEQEVAHLFNRYNMLLNEAVEIVNKGRDTVRTVFATNTNPQEILK